MDHYKLKIQRVSFFESRKFKTKTVYQDAVTSGEVTKTVNAFTVKRHKKQPYTLFKVIAKDVWFDYHHSGVDNRNLIRVCILITIANTGYFDIYYSVRLPC